MNFIRKKGATHLDKQDEEPSDTNSRLNATLKELAADDVDGFFFAIEYAVEELDTNVEVTRQAAERGTDDPDDFYATDLLPASCAVDEEGHMFTAAEVTKALHREDTEFTRLTSLVRRPSFRAKEGVRKVTSTGLSQGPKALEGRSKSFQGVNMSRTLPFKWSLSNYLQSVASTREKRIIAVSAWLLALIGLIISLVFVTKDFLASREELARTIAFDKTDVVEIPTLHFCTTGTQLPPFSDLPNGPYQGQPLIWLDLIRGASLNASIVYPDTKSLSQVRVESFTAAGSRCIALNQMDPTQFELENTRSPSCFHCLTLDRDPMFQLEREAANARAPSNKLVVRLSQNAVVSRCRKSSFGLPYFLTDYFRKVFVHHGIDLELRGILDYGGYNPQIEAHSYILWPRFRRGFQNITRDMRIVDQADMLCNVYMFSGYFYPSTSTGIRYRFNGENYKWERVGSGPYYPRDFNSIANQQGLISQSTSAQIGNEVLEDKALYPGQDLFVMTNYSEDGVNELLGVVPVEKIALLQLERNLILGKNESFRSHTILEDVRSGDVKTQADIYVVEISMLSFLTRVVGEQLSVSWSAFIADFFGLTSLFLDISVYTLIISPLIVRARKRNLRIRKRQRRENESENNVAQR